MSATRVTAIAIRISSAETFAVSLVAIPIMLRVIRIEASMIAGIFLAAIQTIAIAFLHFFATPTVSATIIPATVLRLRRRIERHPNTQQERQY